MMRDKKIKVIFEDITPLLYFCLRRYLRKGYSVAVFDFNQNLKQQSFLKKLINSGRLERIYIKPNTLEHGISIDQTEVIFEKIKKTSIPVNMANLYDTDGTDTIFKKTLVEDIFKNIYIHNYLSNAVQTEASGEKIHFISLSYSIYSQIIKKYGSYNLVLPNNVKIFYWPGLLNYAWRVVFYRLAVLAYWFLKSFALCWGKLRGKKPEIFKFTNALAIDIPFQGIINSDRSAGMFMDGKTISAKNSFFVINCLLEDKLLEEYNKQGYFFIETSKLCGVKKLSEFNYNISFLPRVLKCVLGSFLGWGEPLAFVKAFFTSVRVFMDYSILCQRVKFKNYLYTNQESPRQAMLNVMFRAWGVRSWNYLSFLGGGYIYSDSAANFNEHRHILWSFLNSDCFVGMNANVLDYNVLHKQQVQHYYALGCLYSQSIKENNVVKADFFAKYFTKTTLLPSAKIITFFDTTFIDSPEAVTTYDDCLSFYKDIIRLLDERNDITAIIKPSKPDSWFINSGWQWSLPQKGEKIIALWSVLRANPRVLWISSFESQHWSFSYNSIIMAVSDLVVTHCLSSPTAEALGARKRAIWYESSNKHCGIMYDRIPGLCAHGYRELWERIDHLLYKIADKDYNEYLDKYIKGKIEAYLDGGALTRFRELLM